VAVLGKQPGARVVVVAENFEQSGAFPLLRLGAKGLMTFSEAAEQLLRAVQEVASGGFWVPRTLLSRFVDETISSVVGRRTHGSGASHAGRKKSSRHCWRISNKEMRANSTCRSGPRSSISNYSPSTASAVAPTYSLTTPQLDRSATA
jgi:hypothetical protein